MHSWDIQNNNHHNYNSSDVQTLVWVGGKKIENCKNHSTPDSRVVPHRGTNEAAHRLTLQIGRDAVLSMSYGRG
jgi:hypothetical protein